MKKQNLRNIALKIAYQGQNFSGWQCQPDRRTVEADLRKALYALHKRSLSAPKACGIASAKYRNKDDIVLYAAGRTDAGVHASGQVANFFSDISSESLPTVRLREALNSHLPKDIRILQSWDVAPDFHARHSARARVYHYRIIQGAAVSPEQQQKAWYVREPHLDSTILNCMVSPLLGEHDFSAFTVARDQAKTKVRTLYSSAFYCEGSYLVFRIVGNAFLWHMVRSVVGTAVGLYSQYFKKLEKRRRQEFVSLPGSSNLCIYQELYEQRRELRRQMAERLAQQGLIGGHTGFNAPSQGLNLSQVIYSKGDKQPWFWQV